MIDRLIEGEKRSGLKREAGRRCVWKILDDERFVVVVFE
jgi:hypothetical protein